MAGEVATGIDASTLGRRIVEAARLAVAVHLFESLSATSENYGRRVGIGGAGPFVPGKDDEGGGSDSPAFRRPHSRTGVQAKDGRTPHAAPPFADGDVDRGAGSR
jgi:hypothetical protein